MSSIVAILPAAGLGTRMGADAPKQFRLLDGVPVVVFTLRRLAASPLINSFLIATHADEIRPLNQRIAAEGLARPFRVLDRKEHTSELQSLTNLVCRLLLEKKK